MLAVRSTRSRAKGSKLPMKILVLVSELSPRRSGVALSAERLIEQYRSSGHEVDAIAGSRLPRWARGEVRLSFAFVQWLSLRRKLPEYDCVHVHGPAPTFSDVLLVLLRAATTRRARPKVVYTHHFDLDLPGFRLPCRLYNRLHARAHRWADANVVTSRAYERLLLERGIGGVEVIPWGADHRSYPESTRDERRFDVLAVGQLRPYKGLDVLLRAFARVPDADLHVVGEGHRRRRYEALAARLRLTRARFYGRLPEPELSALFAASHVIVLASVSAMEAFGISLLEGMLAGCVPVASSLPGVAEVVGDAGLLVPPGDPGALSDALRRLQGDPALLARLSSRARERAGRYRWEACCERYLELFERLLNGDGANGHDPKRHRSSPRSACCEKESSSPSP